MMATGREFTGPVNIGNPHEFSIRELAERVSRLTCSRAEIVCRPLPQDDPMQRRPDISLAQRLIDWRPEVSLDDGLTKTIQYFAELMSSHNLGSLARAVKAARAPGASPLAPKDGTWG